MRALATGGERRKNGRNFVPTPVFVAGLAIVTALLIGIDSLTHPSVRLLPLLVFLPAIAAGLGTVAATVIASVWTVLVITGTLIYLGAETDDIALAGGFAAVFGLFSVLSCRYRVRREEEVRRLRSAATALQRLIVRPLPLRTLQVEIDGLYQPVEEEAMVGGDVYDVAPAPGRTRLLIADVQGKGLPAIGMALTVLGSFKEAAYREDTLVGVTESLEKAVTRENASAYYGGEQERLVTALILDIGEELRIEAINCGHIIPFLIHDGDARQVDLGEPEVPLGVASLTRERRQGIGLPFPRGATLLLCTDGVTEARDPSGAFYPLERRLREWARDPPPRLADALGADLRAFTRAAPRDDIAILTIRHTEREETHSGPDGGE
ncbi:PP2C family protein-serine/threonine phosphatase [Spongiactinospora sp. TRM90649]|uniref:PP2C family protein-serine/threonine phosphatase n=1 Tax=Spongiactinospora sp. TRM90649 TaxID=3031114 RepID=UPI0023F6C721|nr:PP2C family protein-serine/threonine phosphatase [Spongiactinospora sp. TRM90649]MDF5753847.1 PP2C family protein-serine/threonine phosphatase [Spongiactinospora sp. TRM90649]